MAEERETESPPYCLLCYNAREWCVHASVGDLTRYLKVTSKHFDDKLPFCYEVTGHRVGKFSVFKYAEEAIQKTVQNIKAYQLQFYKEHCLPKDSSTQSNIIPFSVETEPQPGTSRLIVDQKTPHSEKRNSGEFRKRTRSNETSGGDIWTPTTRSRETPLPPLSWANKVEVWQTMVYREEATSRTRNSRLFEDPSTFLPRMRSILADWIMEVCDVYHLRRNTFYLALDYIDRYLTIKPTVPRQQLQLLGISALFIAAKLEEIYPPKLSEFSYVCDGACSDEDILECEIILLNTLGWDVNPMTPTGWLNLYMQIYASNLKDQSQAAKEVSEKDFLFPQYSAYQFTRTSHLIDLFSLDPGFVLFNYSIIAAAAMYFYFGRGPALQVSGLIWDDLKDCAEYMAVFYTTLRDANDPKLESVATQEVDERQEAAYKSLKIWVPDLTTDEGHSMQPHVVDLNYFEEATLLRLRQMGLSVRKTLIKRKIRGSTSPPNELTTPSSGDPNDTSLTNGNEDPSNAGTDCNNETEEKPIVMFEIEKLISALGEPVYGDDEDVRYFTAKKNYTFDEILIGIHNHTNKILLPRRLSQEDLKQFETTSD